MFSVINNSMPLVDGGCSVFPMQCCILLDQQQTKGEEHHESHQKAFYLLKISCFWKSPFNPSEASQPFTYRGKCSPMNGFEDNSHHQERIAIAYSQEQEGFDGIPLLEYILAQHSQCGRSCPSITALCTGKVKPSPRSKTSHTGKSTALPVQLRLQLGLLSEEVQWSGIAPVQTPDRCSYVS